MIELTRNRAEQIAKRMRERRVVVYGDCMLDEFVWGEVTRISPEAPVPVVDVRNESARLGGAANVFANLRALGVGRASVIGVVGDDTAGKRLLTLLQEAARAARAKNSSRTKRARQPQRRASSRTINSSFALTANDAHPSTAQQSGRSPTFSSGRFKRPMRSSSRITIKAR